MKILYFVGMLGVIGAAALAFMTRSSLLESRNAKDEQNRRTVAVHDATRKINEEKKVVDGEWLTTMTAAKEEEGQTRKHKRDYDDAEKKLTDTKTKIEEIATKRANMEKQIADIVGQVGGTPEEVLAKVEALRGETDALTKELDTLSQEFALNKGKAAESDQLLAKLRALQETRRKAIALSARSGIVAAVNPEFSFVIINFGQKDGITTDTRMIVRRGAQRIARLNIVRIEGSQTVADIDLKSLTPGFEILPGDQVIIETTAS
jgi:hypothetical protein